MLMLNDAFQEPALNFSVVTVPVIWCLSAVSVLADNCMFPLMTCSLFSWINCNVSGTSMVTIPPVLSDVITKDVSLSPAIKHNGTVTVTSDIVLVAVIVTFPAGIVKLYGLLMPEDAVTLLILYPAFGVIATETAAP